MHALEGYWELVTRDMGENDRQFSSRDFTVEP
jgi:hypothetical protein